MEGMNVSVLWAMTSPQLEMDALIQEKELVTQTTPLSTMDHPSVMKALGKEFQKLAAVAQQLEKLGEISVRNALMKILKNTKLSVQVRKIKMISL